MADFRTNPQNPSNNEWAVRAEKHQNITKWMWRIFYVGGALFLLSIIIFSIQTPSFKKLEDPSLNIASEVLADDAVTVLGRLYVENRAPVLYNNIPKHMVSALLATEDARFRDHAGIDPEALLRVFVKTFLMGQSGQGGGSTLTMQLAKLLYSDRDFKNMNIIEKAFGYYYRKLSEMITAVKLERSYTKDEIITMYLNTYDFSYNAHGIRAASEVYFSKAPEQLTMEEAATLVGMCNNSSLYNPIRRNEKTRQRRNLVLDRSREHGVITQRQCNDLKAKPLDISRFKNRSHNDGLATYFRTSLAADVKALIKDKNITKADGSLYDVYRDGLKIYTTVDADMQRMAEESMREHMASLQVKFFKVWKGRDPWTHRDENTTDEQIRRRQVSLDDRIRESNRYQLLRGKHIEDIVVGIEKEIPDLDLTDNDIITMLRQEKQANLFETLLKTNSISRSRVDIYQQIMSSKIWPVLKKKWNVLTADVKTEFSKPTKMTVFAYNAMGEKDTIMTPMDSIRYHRMHLQLGSMAVEPNTGHVKFWVGGIGHKYFQVDHNKLDRQVGSTFKPFIYATAIFNGMSPCMTVTDVPQTISVGEGSFGLIQPWTPKNSTGYSGQSMTLWDALKESRNTASVYLMKRLGSTQPVREIVQNMGIEVDAKSANGQLRIPKTPSICLGSPDLSVWEMTGAYTSFANNGVYIKPQMIVKILDKSGKMLYQSLPTKRNALSENASYVMLQMLKYNVRSAPGIKNLQSEVGGKTGTTNDFRDGWFMGVSPNLVVGTWVGGEDQWMHFLRIDEGQGSYMARPFFAKVMAKIEKNTPEKYDFTKKFTKPEGSLGITMDCGSYYNSGGTTEGGTDEESSVRADQFQDEVGTNKPAAPANPAAPKPVPPPVKPAPKPQKQSDNFDDQ
jgi:penicillin-binding protein 1A